MATRYIADLHLYDPCSLDWRDYLHKTLDEYASYLVTQWNRFTNDDDFVIIVGDVGNYCAATVNVIKVLKGIKILVVGNHDITWGNKIYDANLFKGTHNQIIQNGLYIVHDPNDIDYSIPATYYIHGHHHRYDMPNMYNKLKQYVQDVHRYNCAADLIGHRPCTIQELMLHKELNLEKYRDMTLI